MTKEYWTEFGACFESNTSVFASDNDGLRGASRRLLCVRKPEIPGLHETLMENQFKIDETLGDVIEDWKVHYQGVLRQILSSVPESASELRDKWTDAPHLKRKERVAARKSIYYSGRTQGTRVKKVRYKTKPGEILESGKYLRAVGDLTCPGSTVLAYFMGFVKLAFGTSYTTEGCTCTYVHPEEESMLKNFGNLINLVGVLYFNFFSDDSNFALRCVDGIFRANMDIAACDGSNFDPVFMLLLAAINIDPRFEKDILNAFAQCKSACKMFSSNWLFRVVLFPLFYTLYSGSVLTTAINNMANTLIFLSIVKGLRGRQLRLDEVEAFVEERAAIAGFLVKVQRCHCNQEIQFLKHSPCEDGMFLNLGVILRSAGMRRGDLPGSGDIVKRGFEYTSSIIKSHCYAGSSIITEAYRKRYDAKVAADTSQGSTWQFEKKTDFKVTNNDLCKRYGITEGELQELEHIITNTASCSINRCSASDKIFLVDYGYPTPP